MELWNVICTYFSDVFLLLCTTSSRHLSDECAVVVFGHTDGYCRSLGFRSWVLCKHNLYEVTTPEKLFPRSLIQLARAVFYSFNDTEIYLLEPIDHNTSHERPCVCVCLGYDITRMAGHLGSIDGDLWRATDTDTWAHTRHTIFKSSPLPACVFDSTHNFFFASRRIGWCSTQSVSQRVCVRARVFSIQTQEYIFSKFECAQTTNNYPTKMWIDVAARTPSD